MKPTIRINELARELEVKPKVILDLLPEVGVTEKKTHSSSIDEDAAHRLKDLAIERGISSAAGLGGSSSRQSGSGAVAVEEPPVEAEEEARPARGSVRDHDGSSANGEPATAEAEAPAVKEDNSAKAEPADKPQQAFRPIAAPLRPPLSLGRRDTPPSIPVPPPTPVQERPAPTQAAPTTPSTPPPAPAQPAAPAAPASATPASATPTSTVPASTTPAAPQGPSTPGTPAPPIARQQPLRPAPGGPARNMPIYRPGQGAPSGPRVPIPPAENRPSASPGAPAPRPAPQQPGPMRPAARPGQGLPGQVPRPQGPPPQGGPGQARPNLVGQPAARPIVPPSPDLLRRIQQQARPTPGQAAPPAPRPGMPRPGAPQPGQPIYRPAGPRPGGPGQMRTGPGGPPRPGMRGRPMHPTTPGRAPLEPPPPPTDPQRRLQGKPVGRSVQRNKDREGEEKLLRLMQAKQRAEDESKLAAGKQITVSEGITVKELGEKLGLKASLIVKKLFDKKIFATINQTLDTKLAEEISRDFGATVDHVSFEEESVQDIEMTEVAADLVRRAPVVTIMGHVDHGKTSLLDSIRETNVAAREAGGITQHIGAYQININQKKIVFIDTPGHEAFTRMRARGAKVTDIVILVVAADDGVMPQTLEAIDHAKAAKVPIIVAINKIDRPDAQPDRIKQQLADRGLLAEDWGGDTVMVPVSARTKENLDLLLEMILLVADIADLKTNPGRPGLGTVLEAKLDKGRGPVATVLVQNGTLKVGDFFICGQVFGKVRAMFDDRGGPIRDAEPSTPVEVLGLVELPEVGDSFQVVTDTGKAKQIVVYREAKAREQQMSRGTRVSLESLHEHLKESDVKELNIVLKTDVGGTAEVLAEMLQKLSTEKVKIKVISRGVGAITESDVLLASTSNAIIVGFNVRPERQASNAAEKEKVDIRLHTIIYELTDEIRKAMTGMLEPVFKEAFRGRATVLQIFRISKIGTVAGCMVNEGSITRDSQVRLLRDNIVIHTGKVDALKRFKNDASEVKSGFECGISLVGYNDIKEGDVIEAFVMEKVAAEL